MPINPNIPNQAPTLAIPETAQLHARIAALEARLQDLERIISVGPEGITISTLGNLALKASGDCSLRADKSMIVESRGTLAITVSKDTLIETGKEMMIRAADSFTHNCGSASLVTKKDGTIDLKGGSITIKGSGEINVKASRDLVMKGSKISQN